MKSFKCREPSQHWGAGKGCGSVMIVVLSCSKRKEVGAQWISQYIIHECCREMGVARSVKRPLLKQVREYANTKVFCSLMQ
ncbi:DUF4102 domain-containing protein [Bartonella sp. B1099]|uniref:DUF4102 domain-containing protein n=1 Tax=Bartonella sp. B1099 TaxID=2911422 RepID=UPI0020C25203|nr:DUF4102 domain-containing protein [Bartonella sp. B1099]